MRRPGTKKTYQAFNEAIKSGTNAGARRKRPPPISFRVSEEERERIIRAAGNTPISTYIKLKVLDGRSSTARKHSVDRKAIGHVLSRIGQTGLPVSLNQIAKAASTGALPVSLELEEEIRQACHEVKLLRKELLKALGLRGVQ